MDFQVAGLASGFDWKSLVDQLMAIERSSQTRMRETQSKNEEKKTALNLVDTKLGALDSKLDDLDSEALYKAKAVSLSDDSVGIKATVDTSAAVGNYSFNVSKLASTTKRVGTADVGGGMGDASSVISNLRIKDDITEGNFSVNGQEITVAATDTLQDVFDAISIATSGVVSASYDSGSDKISLTSSSGELELGGDSDTSNFLSAMKLDQLELKDAGGGSSSITSTRALGIVDQDSSIAASGISSGSPITGSGSVIINGVSIDFDADTESVGQLMTKINDSEANVTMSYDTAADQYKIVNNETGSYDMHITDSGNGMMAALGLDGAATVGNDLEYSIDGGPTLFNRSNNISSDSHGIEGLSIAATQVGSQEVGISKDTDELRTKIDSFISSYNDIQDYILEKTKVTVEDTTVTAGVFAGNREINAIDSKLRSLAFQKVDGVGADFFRLEHLGIDFRSGTSKLEIKDSEALDDALENNLGGLEDFFTKGEDSFVSRMKDFVEEMTSSTGVLETQVGTLTSQNKGIDDQIAEMERRLVFQKSAMEASFIAMETAQSNIQQQASALSAIASTSS